MIEIWRFSYNAFIINNIISTLQKLIKTLRKIILKYKIVTHMHKYIYL